MSPHANKLLAHLVNAILLEEIPRAKDNLPGGIVSLNLVRAYYAIPDESIKQACLEIDRWADITRQPSPTCLFRVPVEFSTDLCYSDLHTSFQIATGWQRPLREEMVNVKHAFTDIDDEVFTLEVPCVESNKVPSRVLVDIQRGVKNKNLFERDLLINHWVSGKGHITDIKN